MKAVVTTETVVRVEWYIERYEEHEVDPSSLLDSTAVSVSPDELLGLAVALKEALEVGART